MHSSAFYLFQIIAIFTVITKESHSLIMESVVVPPYVIQGEMAELKCRFQLEHDKLYSVIWYKDHEEFYRYIPKSVPKQQTHKLDGAKIDHQHSGIDQVKMRVFSPTAGGVYRCEVSAEAPSFTSAHGEARMEVVSLPMYDPVITGNIKLQRYKEGDVLDLNCTADKSHPPAQILWFINEKKIKSYSNYKGTIDRGTISELHFQLSPIHLVKETLSVRCVTTVGSQKFPIDTRETVLLVRGKANKPEAILFIYVIFMVIFIKNFQKY